MKKNGFIATSLIYSFFLAFVALVSVILTTYSYYRTILNTLNKDILGGLNTEIQSKYITLENLIQNGSFEDSTNKWGSQVNVEIPASSENISAHGANSIRLNTGNYTANSQVQQPVVVPDNIASIGGTHTYYLRFRIFRNGNLVFSGVIPCLNNLKWQFVLKTSTGNGCFVWADGLILNKDNMQILNKLFGFYQNWREQWNSESADLERMVQNMQNK